MYATDRQMSDRQTSDPHHRLISPPRWRGIINMSGSRSAITPGSDKSAPTGLSIKFVFYDVQRSGLVVPALPGQAGRGTR